MVTSLLLSADESESYTLPRRIVLVLVVALRVKLGFHFIWTLSDCINNAAGLGFSGYDAHGNALWDLTTNVNVYKFELAMNPRTVANQWNITTSRWLRRYAVEPPNNGQVGDENLSIVQRLSPSSEVEMYGQYIGMG